jgi:hypothetical protein
MDDQGNIGGLDAHLGVTPKKVGPIKQFYRDFVMLMTEPRIFFEERYPSTSFTYALTFGVVTGWIAAFFSWLTRIVRHETLLDGLLKMRDKLHELPVWRNLPDNFWAQSTPERANMMPPWLIELFGIVLSPFQTVINLVFYGIVIFIGCYIFVPKISGGAHKDAVELKNVIRIVSFASAPILFASILGFLPFGLGNFFGWLYAFILLIFALSLRFRVSKLRAFAIVSLPGIFMAIFLACLIGVTAALFFGMIASLFSGMGS